MKKIISILLVCVFPLLSLSVFSFATEAEMPTEETTKTTVSAENTAEADAENPAAAPLQFDANGVPFK